ncbi:ThiF family adenylyltransferase [Nocardioides maradonensis]
MDRQKQQGQAGVVAWQKRYPQRWRRELAELRATGWPYKVYYSDGRVRLRINYPLPAASPAVRSAADQRYARLDVTFRNTYPFFPAIVTDRRNDLGLERHRGPTTSRLCLVHDEHHRVDQTVAQLLAEQIPKILRAGRAGVGARFVGRRGDELPVADAIHARVGYSGPTILVPDQPVPAGVEQGRLIIRYAVMGHRSHIGSGLLKTIRGPGVEINADPALARRGAEFPVLSVGRWLRDPEFDPADSAEETWRRVRGRLAPQARKLAADPGLPYVSPRDVETIGLLVPDEVGYRDPGESWLFLFRMRQQPEGKSEGWATYLCNSQTFSPEALALRAPAVQELRRRSAVIVGLGAVGHHIAHDLGLSGVGELHLVDHDRVDAATALRQPAPAAWAGESKARLAAETIQAANPWTHVHPIGIDISDVWETWADPGAERAIVRLRDRLLTADLVIDATANPAVTRWLSALRVAQRRPFLHVSATAGGYGGIVYLQSADTGCWECVERWRAQGARVPERRVLPLPAADPNGWVNPSRCGSVTFTGTRPDLATVAHHASRVATHHLIGDAGLGGDYYVANLRDAYGQPIPVTWRAVPLPQHPACSARHATRAAYSLGRRGRVPGEERCR